MNRKLGILAVSLGIISISLLTWFSVSGPVLVEWYYGIHFGAICDPPLVILNPFRDRDAEQVADRFFVDLKGGNVDVLNEFRLDDERREHFRSRETEFPPKAWFSGSRERVGDIQRINFWIERQYEDGCHSVPASVGLTKAGHEWRVTEYYPIY